MINNEKCGVTLVRVSTDQQDYEAQIADLKEEATRNGYTQLKVIASKETGLADESNKIGINEAFRFIQNNPKYNTLFITEISRLGRRQSVLQSVKEQLIDGGIQLFVKDSNFWLFDRNGQITTTAEMAFTMYALFAENEIKTKKDRFMRARKELKAQGLSVGGKILFGYDRVNNNGQGRSQLIPNDEQKRIVNEIYNWYLNGWDGNPSPSIKAITLHCIKKGYPKYTHSKRNVNKLLKEQAYIGWKETTNKRKNQKYGLVKNPPEYIHN